MKTVRQQLQHISFNLSAHQMRRLTHEDVAAETEARIMNRLRPANKDGAHPNNWQQQGPQHTHTKKCSSIKSNISVETTFCSHKTCSYKQTHGNTLGGFLLAAAIELFTDGPLGRETL